MEKINLSEILGEVATILGGTAQPNYDWSGYIDLPRINELARLYFHVNGQKLRISCGLNILNEHKYYLPSRPDSIGVSASRGAPVIATAIQRRLLPAFETWVLDAAQRIVVRDNQEALQRARAEAIREIIGDPTHGRAPTDFAFWRYYRDEGPSVDGRVCSKDVELTLRVSFEEAKKILRLINQECDHA